YGIVRQDLGVFHDQRDFQDNENTTRRAIGEWLRTHTAPNAVVAMEAIGYQGTFSERRVVDLAGVGTPQVVRIRKEAGAHAGTFARMLDRYHPDAIVLRSYEVFGDLQVNGGPLFQDQAARRAFLGRYQEGARYTAPHPDLWGPYAVLSVFMRKPG